MQLALKKPCICEHLDRKVLEHKGKKKLTDIVKASVQRKTGDYEKPTKLEQEVTITDISENWII